jgi:type IX secretion system substrate protein/VCBS repeat protein
MRLIIRLILLLLLPVGIHAQVSFFQHDTTVKVFAYGREQTLAWCGGFNTPQFSMGDLNNDGLQDLVVFTPWIGVQTFINLGTVGNPNYRYAPEYAVNFPPVFDYLILADYNCDGVPDLFHQGNTGFSVYKGYYNDYSQLCFTFYTDLYYSNDRDAGGTVNAFNNPGDIPSIVDIDGDGDLDFIAYNIVGGQMNLYKNMQVELGLPCDSIHIELKDECWGKVYQGYYRSHQLGFECSNAGLARNSAGKKTHSGNTPCLFDWDMDGDYDYLDGSISFNEMTFLKNGRKEAGSGPDSMVYQDTTWQSGGRQIEIPIFPAAFNIDIDQDGKKDIIVAPNGGNGSSENYNCIWYYKNLSTPGSPNWQFQSDSFLTDMTIDLGTAAYPALFDYNKDGKPDLFVGSDGYFQPSGQLQSSISFYLNTSTEGHPSFTLQTRDFLGISSDNFKGTAPAFGDIDGDGIKDMVIGHSDGTVTYFKNMAASDAVAPDWQLKQLALTDLNGTIINVGGNAAPFIYDIDKDGKADLIVGNIYGYVQYYQNVSITPGTISLKLISTKLGNAKADPVHSYGNYSAPFIGPIDSSGIDYLLLGSNSGNIYKYSGFQTGDTTATYTLLDTNYAFVDSTYNLYNHPGTSYGLYGDLRSTPVVGDIMGDGGHEMIVGNVRGGLEMYKYGVYTPPQPVIKIKPPIAPTLKVFPNPARDELTIAWTGMTNPTLHITIIDVPGQVVYSSEIPASILQSRINVSRLAQGMYICIVQNGGNRYYGKFTVVR